MHHTDQHFSEEASEERASQGVDLQCFRQSAGSPAWTLSALSHYCRERELTKAIKAEQLMP